MNLAQVYYEVIIIDNCSTDGTREWIESISQPNVITILNDTNLGKGGSIKLGISAANGDYILIHDPDLEYSTKDLSLIHI